MDPEDNIQGKTNGHRAAGGNTTEKEIPRAVTRGGNIILGFGGTKFHIKFIQVILGTKIFLECECGLRQGRWRGGIMLPRIGR